MLTVFIIPSHKENADVEKTIASFSGIDFDFKVVGISNPYEINRYKRKDKWFGIFWDNEYIDEAVREALPVFFSHSTLELLILYKKESMVDATWRARLFKRHIYLLNDYRPLSLWLNREVVLDGWVKEHENTS
jgi:hypothetical protein